MSLESERLAIEKRFHDTWVTWAGNPKVVYDNMKFTPTPGTPYVRLSVENVASKQASLGSSRMFRNVGLIFITVFVPEHDGTKNIREYIDTAAGIFRGATFDSIVCRAPYQPETAYNSNGWYRMSVAIPYHTDAVY